MRRFCVAILLVLVTTGCNRKSLAPTPDSGETAVPTRSFSSQNIALPSAKVPAENDVQQTARPVYPFSLVPGGVYSAQELQRALLVSEDLQSHYSNLDASHIKLVRLKENMPAYVSYRHGGQIFWTRHPLLLHSGELVLTDGHYSLRARCANQISMVPREPVEVSPENVEPHLEQALEPLPVDYAKLEPLNSALFPTTTSVPAGPPVTGGPPTGVVVTGTTPVPPVPPLPITPVCTNCGQPGTPPPVAVPEPDSASLAALSLGLVGGVVLLRRWQQRKSTN